MKYVFIQEQSVQYSVALMCQLFSVSRGGYYAWLHYTPSNRMLANQRLDEEISGMVQITPVLVNTLRAESYPDVL